MHQFLFSKVKFFVLVVILLGAYMYPSYGQNDNNKRNRDLIIDTINMTNSSSNITFQLSFTKGVSHNHPTFAIWIEDTVGNFIETLFVTKSFATGIFNYADAGNVTWKNQQGESLRPAALPYWTHKRNIISRDSLYVPTPENPVADALTGATPAGSFVLKTAPEHKLPEKFQVLMEINQKWDWNEYWTNNKYPDDINYKSSAQPSVIYAVTVNLEKEIDDYQLLPIGHGHYAGKDGNLYPDLNSITTALEIVNSIKLQIIK